jgi:hypothetical protein
VADDDDDDKKSSWLQNAFGFVADKATAAGSALADAGSAVVQKVEDAGAAVAQDAQAVVQKVEDTGAAVVQDAKAVVQKVENTGAAVVQKVEDAGAAVVQGAQNLVQSAEDEATSIVGAADNLVKQLEDGSGGLALTDSVEGAVGTPMFGGAFSHTFKIPVPPSPGDGIELGKYAKAKGSLSYTLKVEPSASADSPGKVIYKNGEVDYKGALEKHLTGSTKVVGEGEIAGKKGALGIWAEIEGTKYSKTSIGFEIMDVDGDKGEVTWAALDWHSDFTIPGAEATLLDAKFKYSGTVTPDVKIVPDYAQIGEAVGEKVVTRSGGIAAVSIVLGVALCVATMAAIDALAKSGASETDAATKGRQMLRDYADSYAATVLGKSGGSSQWGKDDGNAYLQQIMSMSQISRDEAIQDCQQNLESQSNKFYYEYQAWSAVVGKVRQSVIDGWKKEHYIAAAFGSQIETIVNVVIEDRYG